MTRPSIYRSGSAIVILTPPKTAHPDLDPRSRNVERQVFIDGSVILQFALTANRLWLMTRLLFFMSEDWYFWVHRRSLAIAAVEAGYHVGLVTRVDRYENAIKELGVDVFPLSRYQRSNLNPFVEFAVLREVVSIYRKFLPDIAHHEALKPVIYGPIASRLTGVKGVVNVLVGLGYLFASSSQKARTLRIGVAPVMRLALNAGNSRVVVQNEGDRQVLLDRGIAEARHMRMIRGTGVDVQRFSPAPEPEGVPVVMLASRILWDKGVGEFVAASRILRNIGYRVRFVLVGVPDSHNPAAISSATIEEWVAEGLVEWWGLREDMPQVLAQATIVCLPSYHEGLPKVLLEAAACGRPIVATDIPGCRAVARDGENALIVPLRDAPAVAMAVATLLDDPDMRNRFASRGREIVVSELSDEIVCRQTLDLYRELLDCR